MNSPNPNISSKLTRCKQCYRLLCKRVPIHMGQDESRIINIKHRGIEIFTFDCTLKCPACGSTYRINGEDGIIGTITNTNRE